jgi:hypothetical protein
MRSNGAKRVSQELCAQANGIGDSVQRPGRFRSKWTKQRCVMGPLCDTRSLLRIALVVVICFDEPRAC